MQGKRAMLLAGVGALAALIGGVPAQAQAQSAARPAVWGDRTGFDDYDWIDRADAISEAVGESPPDTSFIFENGEPWAWTLEDGSMLLVEQLPDGPHGYYFEAGSDAPFLVRDPAMSFGFIDGAVAMVYGADGQALSREEGRGWLAAAMRGYERGRRLKRAMAQRDRQRSMNVGAWYNMSYLLFDWWDDWDYGLLRNPVWRRHHDGPRGHEHRRRWEHERQRREVLSGLFQRWSQGGYRGPPPGRFTPPKPGTPPPPHRGDWHGRDGRRDWHGRDGRGNGQGRGDWHGRDGRGGRNGQGERRPGDPQVEAGLQTDLSINPAQGGVRQQGGPGVSRPPRPGSPAGGYRPRPEPQPAIVPDSAPTPAPAPAPTVAPAAERPAPVPRPDRDPGGRFRQPRPMPEASDDDAPPRPVYSAPRPTRSERPIYTPAPAPSFTPAPAPAPTRSYTPPPSPAPTRSYTPSPSPAPTRSYTPSPSPAPSRSYTPSPSPAPSRSYTPAPAPSRSDPPPVRAKED